MPKKHNERKTASYKIPRKMTTVENLTQHLLLGHFVVDVVLVVVFCFCLALRFCLFGWLVCCCCFFNPQIGH